MAALWSDPPAGLLVEPEADGLRIVLGPGGGPTGLGNLQAFVFAALFTLGVASQGAWWGAAVSGLVGTGLATWWRIRQWTRDEAALHLIVAPNRLQLERRFRGRVLHREQVPLDQVHGVGVQGGLVLHLTGGERLLRARYRDEAQLSWVAGVLARVVREHRAIRSEAESSRTSDAGKRMQELLSRSGSRSTERP